MGNAILKARSESAEEEEEEEDLLVPLTVTRVVTGAAPALHTAFPILPEPAPKMSLTHWFRVLKALTVVPVPLQSEDVYCIMVAELLPQMILALLPPKVIMQLFTTGAFLWEGGERAGVR